MKKLKQIKNIRIPEVRPARIFADRDRDGVANVFDCQPRNPRKQDSDWGDSESNEKKFERFEDKGITDFNITKMTKSQRFKKAGRY